MKTPKSHFCVLYILLNNMSLLFIDPRHLQMATIPATNPALRPPIPCTHGARACSNSRGLATKPTTQVERPAPSLQLPPGTPASVHHNWRFRQMAAIPHRRHHGQPRPSRLDQWALLGENEAARLFKPLRVQRARSHMVAPLAEVNGRAPRRPECVSVLHGVVSGLSDSGVHVSRNGKYWRHVRHF